jgi:hypothetical protein
MRDGVISKEENGIAIPFADFLYFIELERRLYKLSIYTAEECAERWRWLGSHPVVGLSQIEWWLELVMPGALEGLVKATRSALQLARWREQLLSAAHKNHD